MATSITSEVTGKVVVPAGAPAESAAPPKAGYSPLSSKPFYDADIQIQNLVRSVLGLYCDAPFSSAAGHKLLGNFVHNATWDTPFLFARGTDRMRVLARLLSVPCSRVVATPRMLTVSMINEGLGRIDVEGVLEFTPRFLSSIPIVSWLLPESLPVHASWCIIARGSDDKVLSVTETLHNLPKAPYIARALAATGLSTAALTVGNF